jgi:hypothetical protein
MLITSRDEDLGDEIFDTEAKKSHLSSAANGFDSRDFMISANFLQKKIWRDKEGNQKAGDTRDGVKDSIPIVYGQI